MQSVSWDELSSTPISFKTSLKAAVNTRGNQTTMKSHGPCCLLQLAIAERAVLQQQCTLNKHSTVLNVVFASHIQGMYAYLAEASV